MYDHRLTQHATRHWTRWWQSLFQLLHGIASATRLVFAGAEHHYIIQHPHFTRERFMHPSNTQVYPPTIKLHSTAPYQPSSSLPLPWLPAGTKWISVLRTERNLLDWSQRLSLPCGATRPSRIFVSRYWCRCRCWSECCYWRVRSTRKWLVSKRENFPIKRAKSCLIITRLKSTTPYILS
jgi:hypothetical protein